MLLRNLYYFLKKTTDCYRTALLRKLRCKRKLTGKLVEVLTTCYNFAIKQYITCVKEMKNVVGEHFIINSDINLMLALEEIFRGCTPFFKTYFFNLITEKLSISINQKNRSIDFVYLFFLKITCLV